MLLTSRRALRTEGALLAYLRPRLAQDAKIDLRPALADLTAKNFGHRKGALAAAVKTAVGSRLAQDADLDDLPEILEMLEGGGEEEDEMAPNAGAPMGATHPVLEYLKDRLRADDWGRVRDMLGHEETAEEKRARETEDRRRADDRRRAAEDSRRRLGRDESEEETDMRERAMDARHRLGRDETPEEKVEREGEDKKARDRRAADAKQRLGRDESDSEKKEREERERGEDRRQADDRKRADDIRRADDRRAHDQFVTKPALDAALDRAVGEERARQKAIRDAERAVRPWVGDLAMDHADADAVYRAALNALEVDGVDQIHPSAYPAVLRMQPKPGATPMPRLATDSAARKGFAERYPGAMRIGDI